MTGGGILDGFEIVEEGRRVDAPAILLASSQSVGSYGITRELKWCECQP